MTIRDFEAGLEEAYWATASRGLISNVIEVAVDEIEAWQARPLDEVYPTLHLRPAAARQGQRGGHD
uniref:transposase n=1 Tax=Mycobacterium sp. HUMS_1102779 TaxID=3383487 RepID=UPI003899987B